MIIIKTPDFDKITQNVNFFVQYKLILYASNINCKWRTQETKDIPDETKRNTINFSIL